MLMIDIVKTDSGFQPEIVIDMERQVSIKELAVLLSFLRGSPLHSFVYETVTDCMSNKNKKKLDNTLKAVEIISTVIDQKQKEASLLEEAKQPIVPITILTE